jgi:hypothetical protein
MVSKKTNQEKQNRSDELSQKAEYKKYLEELCDPNYQGGSWALPENPTPLEQAKYDICKQVVSYKLDTKINTEEIAQKLQLSKAETEDILYYRIDYFTLDRLVAYATNLFKPFEVKMIVERKKDNLHARVV